MRIKKKAGWINLPCLPIRKQLYNFPPLVWNTERLLFPLHLLQEWLKLSTFLCPDLVKCWLPTFFTSENRNILFIQILSHKPKAPLLLPYWLSHISQKCPSPDAGHHSNATQKCPNCGETHRTAGILSVFILNLSSSHSKLNSSPRETLWILLSILSRYMKWFW